MVSKRLGRIIVLALLVLVWLAFLHFQHRPLAREGHAIAYLGSAAVAVAILAIAAAVGMRVLGRWADGEPGVVPSLALGLALLGMAAFAMASIGALRAWAVWVLLGILAVISYRQLHSMLRRLTRLLRVSPEPSEVAVIGVMTFALVVCLIGSLAPLTANDALVYHLNLPKIYSSAGRLVNLPHNVYANMPHYGEMLYSFVYAAAGETAAKLFYWFFVLAATAAVYALARRLVHRAAALIGAGAFLVQPLVIDHRIVGNVDVMLAFFYLAGIILAFDLCRQPTRWRSLLALAVVAGFMLGIKYTAVILFATVLLIPLLGMPERPALKRMLVAAGIGLLVFLPWAVKNEVWVGNPFYPVFEGVFDGRNWDSVQASQLMAWQRGMGMGRTVADYLLLPFRISLMGRPGMNYTYFDGTLSPLFLVLAPLALFRRKRETSLIAVLALVGFGFWALTAQQLRFLMPTVALLAVLGAVGISNTLNKTRKHLGLVLIALILLVEATTLAVPNQYGRPFVSNACADRLSVVTGLETGQHYLERTLQPYAMMQAVDARLPEHEPLLMIWENRGYYLNRPYLADSFFEASSLMQIAAEAGSAEQLKLRVRAMGFRYVLVNDLLGEVFARGYDQRHTAILSEFIGSHLEPLHSANRLTLYEVKPD